MITSSLRDSVECYSTQSLTIIFIAYDLRLHHAALSTLDKDPIDKV